METAGKIVTTCNRCVFIFDEFCILCVESFTVIKINTSDKMNVRCNNATKTMTITRMSTFLLHQYVWKFVNVNVGSVILGLSFVECTG